MWTPRTSLPKYALHVIHFSQNLSSLPAVLIVTSKLWKLWNWNTWLITERKRCIINLHANRGIMGKRYKTGQCNILASHSSRFFLWYKYTWTRRLFLFLAIRPQMEQLNGPRSSPCSFLACTNRLALLTNVRGHKGHRKGARPPMPTATATVRKKKKGTTYILYINSEIILWIMFYG